MNPQRGFPASVFLEKTAPAALAKVLEENSDEPRAAELAAVLAGRTFPTTKALGAAIRTALPRVGKDESDLTVRRVFQALRIEVNDEFSALDMLSSAICPPCLNPGGRVAILTFHSGEDRRVKKNLSKPACARGSTQKSPMRSSAPQLRNVHDNPRSSPAKLRWARAAEIKAS